MPEPLTFIPAPPLVPEGYVEKHKGYVEQAAAFQARAERAEAENKLLREAAGRAVVVVEALREALDPLVSAGCRLPDAGDDGAVGYVRVTDGQVRAAYKAYLDATPCLLCGARSQYGCLGLEKTP